MKDFTTLLLASLFVGFVLLSLFSLDQGQGLITSHGKIADSADELLETILLHRWK